MTLVDNQHKAGTWTKQYISGKWVEGSGVKMIENITTIHSLSESVPNETTGAARIPSERYYGGILHHFTTDESTSLDTMKKLFG